ncbi:hypothetical protein [Gluconacetobacter diazotrophicus]|uniref:hypothetical protein n=1 Tax=Gluconacetobacter diazotrophicus TaxID=33996 RepID=UPI0011A2F732|nr:hypothetical protein [Gluconacetobacter diazotrophicus]
MTYTNTNNVSPIDATAAKSYPDRYYASYDTTATQPTIITGWYDTWDMSTVSNVPDVSKLIVVDETDWNNTTSFRLSMGKGVQDGKIIDYTLPVAPVPLTTQAQTAMTWVNQQASLVTAMGETFSDTGKAYVKALQAIISGTDTTSTELPEKPTSLT